MPFHIKNPDTDALARKLAGLRKTGLTEAVHFALEEALRNEAAKVSLPEAAAAFCRDLKARAEAMRQAPAPGGPADVLAGVRAEREG